MADLYLECNSGISGDMAVAALLDAGANKEVLQKALDSITAKGFKTEITRVSKNGIDCADFNVILDAEHENHDHDMEYLFGHEDENSHHCEQAVCHSEQRKESLNFPFTEKQDATNAKGFIYIVTNKTKTTLYIGVTSDLKKRIYEHKSHAVEGFTAKYNCENLVYFECFSDIESAIEREKYLKGKNRDYKESLINSINPSWQDLYDYLFRNVSSHPVQELRHSEGLPEESQNNVILNECEESMNKRCFADAQHDEFRHSEQALRHSEQREESHHHEHDEHHHHNHEEDHHHHHEHRNLNDVLEIIDKTKMTNGARSLAHKIFQIIAEAESKAHGLPLDKVHFHEVGAIDSIVDVIALSVCFDNLNPRKVFVPFMNEGTGTVRCQHGILPIPVPAVANIAQKYSLPLHLISDKGEFITPTGAAFVAAVMTDKVLPESFEIKKIGLGAGKRTYSRPSILRAFLINENARHCEQQVRHSEQSEESGISRHSEGLPEESQNNVILNECEESTKRCFVDAQHDGELSDEIVKLETNIDDCTGESLGFVMDGLLAAGARDVNYIPCFMKKNRPAYLLTVICDEKQREKMEEIIFKNTTTIGIRRSVMKRTILDREELELDSPYGKFRAKKVEGNGVKRILPEYDDVAEFARKTGKSFREIYSELSEICTKVLN